MKIAFLTEGRWQGEVPRNHPNMRTDLAWRVALNAEHFHLYDDVRGFDLLIIIIPKKCEDGNFDISLWYHNHYSKSLKVHNGKIAFLQEGPHQYYQDHRLTTQFQYLEFLNSVDIIFCNNEADRRYYRGLFPETSVQLMPTLMIDDSIPIQRLERKENRSGTMIGGNWTSWYSGADSYMMASLLDEPIYSPSMGRKQADEDYIDSINYLPYMNWSEWMVELSKRKYAVHLMRTYAAGSFSLNCGWLQIPCVGYDSIDTQRLCFPELTVSEGDLESVRKIIKHLKENRLFYDHVCAYAKKIVNDIYSEEQFIKNFNERLNNGND